MTARQRLGSHWMATLGVVIALTLFGGRPSAAQVQLVRVIADSASVHVKALDQSAVMVTVPVGTMLEIVGNAGPDWYRVALPSDGSGFMREGFVRSRHVEVRDGGPGGVSTAGRALAAADEVRGPARASAPAAKLPVVAVMPLAFGNNRQDFAGWDIGNLISLMAVDQLVNTDEVDVVERTDLERILQEQDFTMTDRADPQAAKAVRIGRMLGASYLLVGAVTEFSSHDSGGGQSYPGMPSTVVTTAHVSLAMRMIDVSTGRLVASAMRSGDGRTGRTTVGHGSSSDPSGFLTQAAGKAASQAVQQCVESMLERMHRRGI